MAKPYEVWIIERSQDGGGTWRPLQSEGFKLRQATAENLVSNNKISHARGMWTREWRERAVRYIPDYEKAS